MSSLSWSQFTALMGEEGLRCTWTLSLVFPGRSFVHNNDLGEGRAIIPA